MDTPQCHLHRPCHHRRSFITKELLSIAEDKGEVVVYVILTMYVLLFFMLYIWGLLHLGNSLCGGLIFGDAATKMVMELESRFPPSKCHGCIIHSVPSILV